MLKKWSDFFAGGKMTTISGLCLVLSLCQMAGWLDIPFDFAWMSVILSGYPLLYLAITRLYYDHWISSCLLISIAMVASLLIGEIFAAGEVAFIMAIGANLEDMTVARAKKGLNALIDLSPKKARRIVNNVEEMVSIEDVCIDDVVRILPGESIPCDGVILQGQTSVDQSVLTGESLPVDKQMGDEVYCGTTNCFGSIDVKTIQDNKNTSLQRMIRLVQEADEKKAPMQRIADQWSVWLVPIALMIAIGAIVVNAMMGVPFMSALNRGVTVLVVFCPCALALATPTSIMAAIGQATKHGVIIKSGEALETMGKVDTIVFDKTGTLTYGTLVVSDVVAFQKDQDILPICASVEQKSEHPLAKSVCAYAKEKECVLSSCNQFKMVPGRGVQAQVNGSVYYCGSASFLEEHQIFLSDEEKDVVHALKNQGKALILVGLNASCLGLVALSDELRQDMPEIIQSLHDMHVKTQLLSGDSKEAVAYFAKRLNIENTRSELLPEQKVECIQQMKQNGDVVCMLGDGINDAPALKISDVGVAMGGIGSDITVEASDIVFMEDSISKIVYLNHLSKSCIKTIKFNITVSMCINAIAVTLSVLGVLTPVTGAFVHNAGSCLVVLNAALLYDRKFD